jgi:segregation and condensation protein A
MSTQYFVKLDRFEGPLDLLLYLIKVHELDIFDINVLTLTIQYLDYLRLVNFKDLQDAAGFLEMAATLVEIKSRQLLPHTPTHHDAEKQNDAPPEVSLQDRLLLYETFCRAAKALHQKQHTGPISVTNREWQRLEPAFEHVESPLRGDFLTLVVLYEQMLSQLSSHKKANVTAVTERLTVDEVMVKFKERVHTYQLILFQSLWPHMQSRYELVAHILALLQLIRDHHVHISQDALFGPLWVYQPALSEDDVVRLHEAVQTPEISNTCEHTHIQAHPT